MSETEMGFKEISEVHRGEKRSKTLTKLPYHFFEQAEKHLEELRKEYAERVNDPSTTDALVLHDNIKKIDKRLCQIYDLRERKIVIASLNGITGGQPPNSMTQREQALYEDLIRTLKNYRECGQEIPVERQTTFVKATPGKESSPKVTEEEVDDEQKEEKTTCLVRVLEEVPPFVDLDRTYVLKKEDVVTLPEKFARILSLKGAVKILDV